MELRQYLEIVRKWLWLVVLAVGIAAGASLVASLMATPLYTTKTTLMVGRVTQNPDPSSMEINTGQQLAATYAQLSVREPVLKGAIDSLGLNINWESLRNRVRANVIPQTHLLEINVIDSDPYRAKLLADAIAQQLILQSPTMDESITQEQLAFTRQLMDELQRKIEDAQQESILLNQELDAANSARAIQDLQNQINVLETKMNNWQNTYSQLLASLQGGNVNALSVIEEASIPRRPFSPDVVMNVALAAVIGLLLAVGGIFLIEYLDDTIKSPEDINRTTGLSTLGTISRIEGQEYPEKLVALHHPLHPVVETYRVLRTNLQFSSLDKPLNTLAVTSPGPSEGKSLTISNLAVVMAHSGLRVILVDADLRRPTLHKIFGVSNHYGITDIILHGDTSPEEKLQNTEHELLRVLPSGVLPPNPAELLGSDRMRETIYYLTGCADIVLFDTPPALLFADPAILGIHLDGVLLVNDFGGTRRSDARKAVENLRRVKVNILGVVLNNVPPSAGGSYYNYYYGEESGKEQRNGYKAGTLLGHRLRLPIFNPTTEKRDR
ncbi:MAG: polysaccharide biosynthesis tyrosine autokinase [Chloroflexi bacterium]|nr:polysaccharide biosynthesis tyrosine autokinase [Chloroflexota bacterium]